LSVLGNLTSTQGEFMLESSSWAVVPIILAHSVGSEYSPTLPAASQDWSQEQKQLSLRFRLLQKKKKLPPGLLLMGATAKHRQTLRAAR
jgi:hypothetical protein